VCPIECRSGETLRGETCVADEKPNEKPKASPATASRKNEDEEDTRPRRKQTSRQPEREEPRRARPAPEPVRARQQAVARPSIVSSGGGGGGGGGRTQAIIGVGF
jgi:hypothetical protein